MKFKFNPIIFKIQKRGGISTLWRSLMGFDNPNKFKQSYDSDNFLSEKIIICKASRIVFANKNEFYLNSFHTIKLGPGLSISVCHDLMEERKVGLIAFLKRIYIHMAY